MLRILFVIPYLEVEQSVKQVFQESCIPEGRRDQL